MLEGSRRIAAVAALSGACGLGSETLFFKLLDYSVGSAAIVSLVVVATFILGMGMGSLLSPFVRRPWMVEALLAVYYAGWLLLFDDVLHVNGALLEWLAPRLGANAACSLLGFAYLAPPALLLGVTLPALVERNASASPPYMWHACGALTGVAAVEAVLFPYVGIPGCLAVLAAGHAASAVLLHGHMFTFAIARPEAPSPSLLIMGVSTGAFQGVWLFVAVLLFQPRYFVQPVVVATMLAGLALGALLWSRLRLREVTVALSFVGAACVSVAMLAGWVAVSPENHSVNALWALPAMLLPAAIFAGMLFPSHLSRRAATRGSGGAALLALAVGNAIGVIAAGTILLPHVRASVALFVALCPAVGVAVWLSRRQHRLRTMVVVASTAIAGYAAAHSVSTADLIRLLPDHRERDVSIDYLVRGPGELSAVYSYPDARDGAPATVRRLYQTGFSPVRLDRSAEGVIGAVGAAYAHQRDRALVLGAGSGRSAGVVAAMFAHVDIVDIDSTTADMLGALRADNFGVLERDNVALHAIDAVVAPDVLPTGYDLIVITVDPSFVSKAAKLYTTHSFHRLRDLLAPGGVLILWSDMSLGPVGNQILINTAAVPFAHQKLYSVYGDQGGAAELNYYLLVQSDEPLSFRPAELSVPPDMAASDHIAAALASPEVERLLRGRAHATTRVHRLARPAREILHGGTHADPIPMRRSDAP